MDFVAKIKQSVMIVEIDAVNPVLSVETIHFIISKLIVFLRKKHLGKKEKLKDLKK